MNYKVKADNPDVAFSVELGEVTDSEGNKVEGAALIVDIQSTNQDVVALGLNEDGRSGIAHFGSPGIAAVTVQVRDTNGNVLASGGDNFTVTTGDPAAISSVKTSFEGLQADVEGSGGVIETPTEETPAEEAPVEEAPVEAPAEETPTEEFPAEPVEETPTEEVPTEEVPTEEVPAEPTPEEAPTEEPTEPTSQPEEDRPVI